MKRFYTIIFSLTLIAISFLSFFQVQALAPIEKTCLTVHANDSCPINPQKAGVAKSLSEIKAPSLSLPEWARPRPVARVVTYTVMTRGYITADTSEFARQAQETYDDSRGWSRMGIQFKKVDAQAEFTLYLAASDQMTSFSAEGCDSTYSCQVGRDVIINQDRWLGATSSWNAGGGSLRDYRHMVINHETGHWLGHDHVNCPQAGQPAAVMQQQSINLQGCSFNPWPLQSELYSSTLGIR